MKTYPQVLSVVGGLVVLVAGFAFGDELTGCARQACDDESDATCAPAQAAYRACTSRAPGVYAKGQATGVNPGRQGQTQGARTATKGDMGQGGVTPPSGMPSAGPVSLAGAHSALPASVTGGAGMGAAHGGAAPRSSGGHSKR
jgi:hypothetical protein